MTEGRNGEHGYRGLKGVSPSIGNSSGRSALSVLCNWACGLLARSVRIGDKKPGNIGDIRICLVKSAFSTSLNMYIELRISMNLQLLRLCVSATNLLISGPVGHAQTAGVRPVARHRHRHL